jgi:formylglycine-generating enzyme required for sulfatase activity
MQAWRRRAWRQARPGLLAALVATTFAGCNDSSAPRDQWVLTVGTDAPLPGLADRLRIEVLDASGNACNACRRDFGANDPAAFPLSIGITKDAHFNLVRARLYRVDHLLPDGQPDPATTIDVTGRLPGFPVQVESLSLPMTMSCMGVPSDPVGGTSCDPAAGTPAPLKSLSNDAVPAPGSWAPGKDVPCVGALPEGMACIEGGAFFMGDDKAPPYGAGGSVGLDVAPEHLIQLSPYAMDKDELTVGEFRAIVKAHPEIKDRPARKSTDAFAFLNACSFIGDDDASNDAQSLNCTPRALASTICKAQGKELPTEAQFEFAARNRSARTYPWGEDAEPCTYAIIARARTIFELGGNGPDGALDCRTHGDGTLDPWGPVAGGSPRDVTLQGVRNLGGNLAEWVQDDVLSYASSCWTSARLLVDPVCKGSGQPTAARGGSFISSPPFARAVFRTPVGAKDVGYPVGFRCVKPMR